MYGPVRTVVWQGSAGDRRPYADLTRNPEVAPTALAHGLDRKTIAEQLVPYRKCRCGTGWRGLELETGT